MYKEVEEYLRKIEGELKNTYGEVDIQLLNNLEHILFECWSNGFDDGFRARE